MSSVGESRRRPMFEPFRTLRFKLTVLYVVVFGLLQALLWLSIDLMLTRELRERFDQELLQRASGLVETLGRTFAEATPAPRAVADALKPFWGQNIYFEVTDAGGDVLARSPSMRGLDFPARRLSGDDPLRIETLRGEVAAALAGQGASLRMVTIHHPMPGGALRVQAASDAGPLNRMLSEVHRVLVLFALVSLLIAAVTSWLLAQRSLAPIGEIARRARHLSAQRLSERIPMPSAHDEVAEMVAVINEMLDRLEHEFADQRRFIAGVTHELKTPLAVLMGETQSIRKQRPHDRDYEAYVETVQEETRALFRRIDGLLTLSRLRDAKRPPIFSDVDMEDVAIRAIDACRYEARKREVRIVPILDEAHAGADPTQPTVLGERELLHSLAENLVHNAVRHSPAGGTVDVRVECAGPHVLLTVRDQGPGIPPDQIDRVFDLYYQVAPGSPHAGKGGVGLSIARAVCELHRGSISAANRPDGGCEFVARLPLSQAAGAYAP